MLAAFALAAALAGQAPTQNASQPTLVGEWRSFCAANRDDFAKALAGAGAAGWMVAPDTVVAKLSSPSLGKPQVMLRSSATGIHVLLVGVSDSFRPLADGVPFHVRYCGIGGLPPDPSVDEEVKAFAAVPPNPAFSADGTAAYVYRDGPHGREPVLDKPSDAEARKLLSEGRLNMVLAKAKDGSMSMVLFAVPAL